MIFSNNSEKNSLKHGKWANLTHSYRFKYLYNITESYQRSAEVFVFENTKWGESEFCLWKESLFL